MKAKEFWRKSTNAIFLVSSIMIYNHATDAGFSQAFVIMTIFMMALASYLLQEDAPKA